MPHNCPFPVRSTDSRLCYRTGSGLGFTLSLTLIAILAGYAGLSHAASVNKPDKTIEIPVSSGAVVGWAKGRLLVAPRAGLPDAEFEKILKTHNVVPRGHFRQINTYVLELPPGVSEVAVMNILRKNRNLKYVELDMAMAPAATVNDPALSNSWALPKIQAPAAWDVTNGSGVTIAILDTGVDGTHPDLAANMVPGWNVYNNNADTSDVHGHGTSVSGAAAMSGNNSVGSAGVAWGARIMPVRIADPDGYAYYSTIAQGINWAADNGAKVVNISYGVSGSSAVQSAAQYLRNKGGVAVVAGGNSGVLENTAASDTLLSISATDSGDARTSWSTYGNFIDLAAPGLSIYAPTRGGGYANVSGTSFASPITAATVALMMSANSTLTPADIDTILKSTAVDLGTAGFDPYYGAGRIDAARAVAAARNVVAVDTQSPVISITSPTGGNVASIVPVDVNYSDNVGVTRAELYVNGTKVITDDVAPFAFAWDTAAYADGAYSLSARAYDAAGNVGTSSSVSVTIGNDMEAPVISDFSLTNGMTISDRRVFVSASATDNQSVTRISLTIDGAEISVANGGSISYNWNLRKAAKGAHYVTVQAWDGAGNTTSKSVTVYK